MAAVQPHVASRQHPPAPAAPSSQAPAARPPCKRGRADASVAVTHGSRKQQERVAESCCPSSSEPDRELELVLVGDDSGDEDGGCGSFVAGGCGGHQEDDEEETEEISRSVVDYWWRHQESSSGGQRCSLWANGSMAAEGGRLRAGAGGERDGEDPKVAEARRQEEDRKFWEACLASGYP